MHYLKNEQECFAEVKTRGAAPSDVSLSSNQCHRALHSAQDGLSRVASLDWLPVFWVCHNAGSLSRRRNLISVSSSPEVSLGKQPTFGGATTVFLTK